MGADPAGKIPAAPAPGEPLPADVQVELTLDGHHHVWSGAELKALHGEVRADQTILLGILQGLVEREGKAKSGAPEFTPVLDFKKKAGISMGPPAPMERGGPPEDAVHPPKKPLQPLKPRPALKPLPPGPRSFGSR